MMMLMAQGPRCNMHRMPVHKTRHVDDRDGDDGADGLKRRSRANTDDDDNDDDRNRTFPLVTAVGSCRLTNEDDKASVE